eukprot:scaffold93153_cov31-Tisochrysis_lutea.AAC.2
MSQVRVLSLHCVVQGAEARIRGCGCCPSGEECSSAQGKERDRLLYGDERAKKGVEAHLEDHPHEEGAQHLTRGG